MGGDRPSKRNVPAAPESVVGSSLADGQALSIQTTSGVVAKGGRRSKGALNRRRKDPLGPRSFILEQVISTAKTPSRQAMSIHGLMVSQALGQSVCQATSRLMFLENDIRLLLIEWLHRLGVLAVRK